MKTAFLKYLPIIAAVLLATSCSKDDNDNAPTNGRDGVHTVSTSGIPFSIRVNTGRSLKKVGYAESTNEGEKGWYNITFSDNDVAKLKMIIKEGNTQIGEATLQSDKATFSGSLTQQPSSNASLTAEITVTPAEAKTFSDESLAALLATCAHNFIGEFKFGDKTVDLTDQNAYLAISMSPCCEHEIKINTTDYTVKDGRIWISVPTSANVTSTGLGEEISKSATEVVPGTIYTVARQYFSVSPTKKVYFSKGNLQYNVTEGETLKWKFADNQYDYIGGTVKGTHKGNVAGSTNTNVAGPWIDLFGWGMWLDGQDPTKTVADNTSYLPDVRSGNFTGASAIGSEWETLTCGNDRNPGEWNYLLGLNGCTARANAADLNHWATVNGVHGLVILPDGYAYESIDWNSPDWTDLEKAGAVFLPASGHRYGSGVDVPGDYGYYWSSSSSGEDGAFYLNFGGGYVVWSSNVRYDGQSVRLVRPLK